jgi:pimeloyl-ACP methyl ester carboxylesterase
MPSQATGEVRVDAGPTALAADLGVPEGATGLVIFAHGSGSSRFSRRNRSVAGVLQAAGFATLLLDLLTPQEQSIDEAAGRYRFDIGLLGGRVIAAADWAQTRADLLLPIALFGASTGAAAALIAAAARPEITRAVISRGGRPDLADTALPYVQAPTLLIVGGDDEPVIEMNRQAMRRMRARVELEIVPGATHLFEEPGALDHVARLAAAWCRTHVSEGRRREIPRAEWVSFLERFSREHRAWLVRIERRRPGADRQIEAETLERPLRAVTAETAGGTAAIEITLQEQPETAHAIRVDAPLRLRVDETPEGATRTLEIEDGQGQVTRLSFRVAVAPGVLDGVAPAEGGDEGLRTL